MNLCLSSVSHTAFTSNTMSGLERNSSGASVSGDSVERSVQFVAKVANGMAFRTIGMDSTKDRGTNTVS